MVSNRAANLNDNASSLKIARDYISTFLLILGIVIITLRYKNKLQDEIAVLEKFKTRISQIRVVANSTTSKARTPEWKQNQDSHQNPFLYSRDKVYQLTKHILRRPCAIPNLQPFGKEIIPLIKHLEKIKCPELANTFGNVAFVQPRGKSIIKRLHDMGTCCYRPFFRINDLHYSDDGRCFPISDNDTTTIIPQDVEFLEVECEPRENEKHGYRDGFSFIQRKSEVESRILNATRTGDKSDKLSVIILGLDATSRMNFIRMAPKSNAYLLQNLTAIAMKGYTKVGENTYPNLIPLLAGQTVEEFEENCINNSNGSKSPWELHLDGCPFIWKQFARSGYRTGYAEDDTTIGNFYMYFIKPFDKSPTDYYLNTFSRLMVHKQSTAKKLCYGTRTPFRILLDNLENMAEVFKNDLYFQFTWSIRYSHDDFNLLSLADDDLLSFLTFMNDSGLLNKTVLILLSDHGSRLDHIRATEQGKIEDRMPLLYFALPPWFSEKYPEAYSNLRGNSDRPTSPFDVHKTLQDFLNLTKLEEIKRKKPSTNINSKPVEFMTRRPSSLFQAIPEIRSCFEAGVNLQWCVCHKGIRVPELQSEEVQKAVAFSIESMNYILRDQKSCALLTLNATTDAFKLGLDNLKLKGDRGRNESKSEFGVLRVSFVTMPGEGAFEATVIKTAKGQLGLAERVVRTNYYGDQGACVPQSFREYCYCV